MWSTPACQMCLKVEDTWMGSGHREPSPLWGLLSTLHSRKRRKRCQHLAQPLPQPLLLEPVVPQSATQCSPGLPLYAPKQA